MLFKYLIGNSISDIFVLCWLWYKLFEFIFEYYFEWNDMDSIEAEFINQGITVGCLDDAKTVLKTRGWLQLFVVV